ncbi:hypothetical protein CTAM01_08488 [Colletotrichum tamarilloi]|uniref:Uncharacterized protein n=1 Tax=Colletotrichum tamarilloi TaxID=1209934 RepID=A0ABQ9R5L2_9PEZI|nr:uncharacterized protein CTAM01_08488 [Colletotrichum tamarilloi]KAK1495359.1 hypothetical protein CTAM01_08488 [Colletotrichum tamarilloi]
MRGNFKHSKASGELFSERRRPLTRPEASSPPRPLTEPNTTNLGVGNPRPSENRKRLRSQQERIPLVPHPEYRRGGAEGRSRGTGVSDAPRQVLGESRAAQSSLLNTVPQQIPPNPTFQRGNFKDFRIELKPRGDSSVRTLLKTNYDSACPETLLAYSAAKRLGLELIPGQPGKEYTVCTAFVYTKTKTFVRVHVRVPGFEAVLGDCNFAVVPDDVLGPVPFDIVVGRRQIDRLVTDCGLSRETLNDIDFNILRQRMSCPLNLSESLATLGMCLRLNHSELELKAIGTAPVPPRNLERMRTSSEFLQPGYQQQTNSFPSQQPSYYALTPSTSGAPRQSTPGTSISFAHQPSTSNNLKQDDTNLVTPKGPDDLQDDVVLKFGTADFDFGFSFEQPLREDAASGPSKSPAYSLNEQQQLGHLVVLGSSTDNGFETTTPMLQTQTPLGIPEASSMAAWTPNKTFRRPTSRIPTASREHQLPQVMVQEPFEETIYSPRADPSSNDVLSPRYHSEG